MSEATGGKEKNFMFGGNKMSEATKFFIYLRSELIFKGDFDLKGNFVLQIRSTGYFACEMVFLI